MVEISTIVLCAGMGTRMKSQGGKVLHLLCGKPLCYWPIKHAVELSSHKPIVVVGHQSEQVRKEVECYFSGKVDFAVQEVLNGTGGAVQAAMPFLQGRSGSVLVLYGDVPLLTKNVLKQLLALQMQTRAPIAMLTTTTDVPTGYGRIIRDAEQNVVGIVEESDASFLQRKIQEINPGVYVFDVSFLQEHIVQLRNDNAKREYQTVDLINLYGAQGQKQGPIQHIYVPYEETHGINDRLQLAYAEKILRKRINERWMLEGVTIVNPESTYIDEGVHLSQDCILYPQVHLRGQTRVGEGVAIENGCILNDTIVEKGAHLFPYTVCDKAFIGEQAQVGPFARLRPEAHLEEQVRVGNFVEIKRSRLKKGAKAGHLSYVGDAEIGLGSNIGAGTITCNYDGAAKNQTIIGDSVFVGSNTTLIAPLSIGDGAYVAGGSTLTEAVEPGTLAFGRARQVNKLGRAKKTSKAHD